mmetsp:Transcript_13650/g.18902  ORF Transcript_13650/g.18902 Transcript_13650/m.18902 type:complete len:82 (+) Transcript_13650:347-592(+)
MREVGTHGFASKLGSNVEPKCDERKAKILLKIDPAGKELYFDRESIPLEKAHVQFAVSMSGCFNSRSTRDRNAPQPSRNMW